MTSYTNSDGYSFVRTVCTFSNVSRTASFPELFISDSVDIQKRMPEYHYYRTLWWEKGDFHQKANWEEVTNCDRKCGKEADASFRPKKLAVTVQNKSDGNSLPWPNLVVEVAYTETLDHVEEALRYWLNPGRAHGCIIVKIDPIPQGQIPTRMRLGITVSQQVEEQEIRFLL
ncbi:4121_t:CDS:2 [Acaulospora morrowiae]|uniref:4121_t:CDS:1 n=1 Tax=Acaulospora morrowiae TaxID=94023 RepID=A0A9N8VFU6_9GLOM|nr:4121_t:CDS:2 [Acaulospora morrowiae]